MADPIPEWAILRARELMAAEVDPQWAKNYHKGMYDAYPYIPVLARVLADQPPQPTFEQRVDALAKVMDWPSSTASLKQSRIEAELAEIMAPKVDPLVEAFRALPLDGDAGCDRLTDAEWQRVADVARKALAAGGLEIVESNND